jgi:hypothetical protein
MNPTYQNYTAEEMGTILGISPANIVRYGEKGELSWGQESGIQVYFLNQSGIGRILEKERKKPDNHGKITKKGKAYTVNKTSLDALIETARLTKPEIIHLNAEPIETASGVVFNGTVRAYFEVSQVLAPLKLRIMYEEGYNAADTLTQARGIRDGFISGLTSKLEAAKQKDEGLKTRIEIENRESKKTAKPLYKRRY